VDFVLCLTELKRKFNQVCPHQTAQIYRCVMHWEKSMKETENVVRKHGPPRCTVFQENVELIREVFQRSSRKSVRRGKFIIRPIALSCS